MPVTAYAADTETPIGFSDSGGAPSEEQATPTSMAEETPVTTPEAGASGQPEDAPAEEPPATTPEELPGDMPEETPAASCETPGISLFSEFTGDENEFFTRIRLTVTDRQGNPLSGVVYGLYDMNGQLVEYLTTNAYGEALSGDHPVNTDYYLEEITPPTGFSPNTGRRDIILSEVCAPSLIGVTVEYDPIMGRIKVVKTTRTDIPCPARAFMFTTTAPARWRIPLSPGRMERRQPAICLTAGTNCTSTLYRRASRAAVIIWP